MKAQKNNFAGRWETLKSWALHHSFLTINAGLVLCWLVVSTSLYFVESGHPGANIQSYEDALWWGIVTLLTVGYGDFYPVTTVGRFLGIILMNAGVVAVSVVTARISMNYLENALSQRRGQVDSSKIQDHIIVCGWKEDLQDLLLHILSSNPGLESDKILLINDAEESEFEALQAHKELRKMKYIKGPFFHEIQIKRSAPERARKIIILADRTISKSGQAPTSTEIDARTIMTAMTINNLTKETPIVAEVLDSSMDQYLKLANVNEIVYSRDYSRLLLGKASRGMGITNIVHELLTQEAGANLTTLEIPDEYLGQSYENLQFHFAEKHPNMLLLGLLENSGNSHLAKASALRKAQMTPNVEQLVDNLKSVKKMTFNKPVFNPKNDHPIGQGSLAMVIEQREPPANEF